MRESQPLAGRLLAWYDDHRRDLPWRAPPGRRPDPYRVWLSEIMLQQTTVAAVAPYYRAFVARWPNVGDLAAAGLDDVLRAWQGLGYYARARNLHKCARQVATAHAGRFPDREAGLAALPGIGAYTAAAIAAIAFDHAATVVDGNVERVVARLYGVAEPLPGIKPKLRALAGDLTPAERPGDYAQAVMDLGATICVPRRPACGRCPWAEACVARAAGNADELPRREKKKARPTRRAVAFLTRRSDGAILLRRRPDNGLLGGMMEVPSTPWREAAWDVESALGHAPAAAAGGAGWRRVPGRVVHLFTHFRLEIEVMAIALTPRIDVAGEWCAVESLGERALPTVMKKVIRHGLGDL